MTSSDLLATLGRLHLTPPEAARLLGYNKTSVYRWIRGAATVPPCVERVLWACERDPSMIVAMIWDGFVLWEDEAAEQMQEIKRVSAIAAWNRRDAGSEG